jgi:predicted helicase
MTLNQYIENLSRRYKLGNATEHTFRGDLQQLLEFIAPNVSATNEPKRIKCGAPDYVLMKHEIPVGFIEAKDIGADLSSKAFKEQFDRYKASLNNLIFTDYLDFQLYIDGEFKTSIKIGERSNGAIKPLVKNFDAFTNLIKDFVARTSQTITTSKKLAEMMAGKARILSDVIEKSLQRDEKSEEDSTLKDQLRAFKSILIHDITEKEFADVYAQTIAYGMFAARLHDTSLGTFTRQEAAELIPKSNPFLRKLFGYIAGPDIDDRIKWIVDALADIFRATDVNGLLKDFGKATETRDPIIHFYETFLSEYAPKLRKSRGVWYTPEPVVNFIVRAVDDILKTEFNLPEGLADTSKTKIRVKTQTIDSRYKQGVRDYEKEVHKVQILDPATGTGTFLAHVVKHIHAKFKGQQGIWSKYVESHLIPRLNGFELLMASYAMAHLKLDMLLGETGFKPSSAQRMNIYLTNSLEEHHPDTGTLWATWLSTEANEANHIKRDTPVMCVIGNPPYSGESQNKGNWIMDLMDDYKKEPGSKKKIKGESLKWINADEYKFIRFAQHFIEKNGEGILAFINPNTFLDNRTFRGMRWNLLKTYDKIYILDLHGNSKKQETAPDGSVDKNVFDVKQGVSINIFIKTGKKKKDELGKVFHYDLLGNRQFKYDFLFENSLNTILYEELTNVAPNYFFVKKVFKDQNIYEKGFSINKLFPLNSVGIVTARDTFTIHHSKQIVENTITEFLSLENEPARNRFDLGKDVRDWKVAFAKKDLEDNFPNKGSFAKISYRPFDDRWTFYTGKSKGFHCYPRNEVMKHFLGKENIGLMCCKQTATNTWEHIGITKYIADDSRVSNRTKERGYIFPLYLYSGKAKQGDLYSTMTRTPNLNEEIVKKIAGSVGLKFTDEKEDENTFAPIDILDYIYAVLHSPTYRERYKEFFKIDFPRVPYPKEAATFWQLVELGKELRQIHLLESPKVSEYITQYPVDGDNVVIKPNYTNGKVWINETQYFDNVPLTAWEFHIGGYQPAQKWLKDRKDRALGFEDIFHYQKIVVALAETERLMKEIDKIEID